MGRGKKWSEEEVNFLMDYWGETSVTHIANKLNRPESAIIARAWKMKLGSFYCYNFLNIREISDMIGVDNKTVKRWIGLGLKAKKVGNLNLVKPDNLIKFLKKNQHLWNSNKLELYAFGKEYDWLKVKRERDKIIPFNKHSKWSYEDERLLICLYKNKNNSIEDIALILKRSEKAVQRKISRLKDRGELPKRALVPWTEKENLMLFEMDRKGIPDTEIAWELGREVTHIGDHRRNLKNKGLYPGTNKISLKIDAETVEMIEMLENGATRKEIAEKFNISKTTISRRILRYKRKYELC